MNKIKKIFNKRSKLLFILTFFETVFTWYFLVYFNYMDRLNYIESISTKTQNLALVFQNMYTSTFWGLIIIILVFISIFAIISLIYNDHKYQLISLLLWIVLFALAINIKAGFKDNISILCIFVPIILVNYLAFKNQKTISNMK